MAIEVKGPQFELGRLSPTMAPGTIVHADGKLALVAVSGDAAAGRTPPLLLASFDPQKKMFMLSPYDGNTVLALRGDVVIEPDLSIPGGRGSPGAGSTTECYFNGEAFFIPLSVPAAPDQRPILNLDSGTVHSQWINQAHVFERWRLGVRHDGRVTWVLAIGADLIPWASDVI